MRGAWPLLLVLVVGCPRKDPHEVPIIVPDLVWEKRVELVLATLTEDTLVPGTAEAISAAGWQAIGEPSAPDLAHGIAKRIADGSLTPAKAWEAIAAMARAVDDPHTMLISPDGLEQFGASLQGQPFTAPGLVVAWTPARELVVTETLAGGPAVAAGVAVGDVITAMNGAPPARTWSVVTATFVAEGTPVALTVTRAGAPVEVGYTATPYAHPVSAHRIVGEVGILRSYYFATSDDPTRNSFELARAARADFDRANVTALVLDLRGNQGGEGVARFASLFTGADPVLVSEDEPWPNPREGSPTLRPLVVLVDEQSVSAAEMVALALQQREAVHVIGQPTGNALNVPLPVDLGDGYLLLRPRQAVGAPGLPAQLRVEPDELVPNRTVDDVRAGRDPQLDAALRWLGSR